MLKKCRTSRKLTLEQLADMTGLSKGFLSQIENSKRKASQDTLNLISEALDIPATILLADDDAAYEASLIFESLSDARKTEALDYLRFLSASEARKAQ